MDPHSIENWEKILGQVPCPEGTNADLLCARRVIGDLIGYQHPGGNQQTYKRRLGVKNRDAEELKNAMIAFARMYFDAKVRP